MRVDFSIVFNLGIMRFAKNNLGKVAQRVWLKDSCYHSDTSYTRPYPGLLSHASGRFISVSVVMLLALAHSNIVKNQEILFYFVFRFNGDVIDTQHGISFRCTT